MITPAVCPRLFEFRTTLTFGAQRSSRKSVNSIGYRRNKKKRQEGSLSTCDQQLIMSCQERKVGSPSWPMRWLVCGEKKEKGRDAQDGPKKNRYL